LGPFLKLHDKSDFGPCSSKTTTRKALPDRHICQSSPDEISHTGAVAGFLQAFGGMRGQNHIDLCGIRYADLHRPSGKFMMLMAVTQTPVLPTP
jgi:hypothetical protein